LSAACSKQASATIAKSNTTKSFGF
jgi:hypothetical protein